MKPNEAISLDLYGPLPMTNTGKKYVVVMIDQFSRKVSLSATEDRTAKSTIKATRKMIKKHFISCEYIITDNAKEFKSKECQSLATEFNLVERTISPYNPESNMAERVMKDLGRIMRSYTYFNHRKWDSYLTRIEKTMNSTWHSAIQEVPYNITNDEKIKIPCGLGANLPRVDVNKKIEKIRKVNEETIRKKLEKQRKHKKPRKPFELGEMVLMKTTRLSDKYKGKTKKLYFLRSRDMGL